MSEIIERVGRALAKNEGYAYDPWPYDGRARDAIKALREPTEAMFAAGQAGDKWSEMDARLIWRAMIDEALK